VTDSRVGMKRVSALVRLVLCLAVATCLLAPTPVSGITYSGTGCDSCPWGLRVRGKGNRDPYGNYKYEYCKINSGFSSSSQAYCKEARCILRDSIEVYGMHGCWRYLSWSITSTCADACTPGAKRCTSSTVRETCNDGCPGTCIYLPHSHSIVILFSSFLHPHLCLVPPPLSSLSI
jgi:hypothetical protein